MQCAVHEDVMVAFVCQALVLLCWCGVSIKLGRVAQSMVDALIHGGGGALQCMRPGFNVCCYIQGCQSPLITIM
jgi:hypothetical protein